MEDATKQLLEEAEPMFRSCYAQYSELYSPNHLEAIKCITMLGLVYRKLQRLREAHDWTRKEVKAREEVQGELHPRTQQARRVYTELVERIRNAAKTGKGSCDSQAGAASMATVADEDDLSCEREQSSKKEGADGAKEGADGAKEASNAEQGQSHVKVEDEAK
jgi:hypothetical protein